MQTRVSVPAPARAPNPAPKRNKLVGVRFTGPELQALCDHAREQHPGVPLAVVVRLAALDAVERDAGPCLIRRQVEFLAALQSGRTLKEVRELYDHFVLGQPGV